MVLATEGSNGDHGKEIRDARCARLEVKSRVSNHCSVDSTISGEPQALPIQEIPEAGVPPIPHGELGFSIYVPSSDLKSGLTGAQEEDDSSANPCGDVSVLLSLL